MFAPISLAFSRDFKELGASFWEVDYELLTTKSDVERVGKVVSRIEVRAVLDARDEAEERASRVAVLHALELRLRDLGAW